MRQHHNIFTARITDYGGPGDDELTGGPGDDDLRGYGGDDELTGNGGADRMAGMAGYDGLYGGPGNDTSYGGPGDDLLDGGAGNDRLYGGPGDDWLEGGAGDDLLSGGPGADLLIGGDGRDTFRFAPGHSGDILADVIADFDYAAGDRILLTGFSSGAASLSPAYDEGGDLRGDDRDVILPDGGRVILRDVGDVDLSIETLTGAAQAAVAPAVDPDPAPDILADGETWLVDHWISRWSLRIDEAPAIGATYHLVLDEGVLTFGLGATHAVTGQVIWTNGMGTHPDFSDETMHRQIASGLDWLTWQAGYGTPNSPVSVRVSEGGGTDADPYVLEINKPIDLQAREGSGIGFVWDGEPGGASITEVAATHPAAFTLTFDEREVELPIDVGKAGLDGLAEYVFYDLGLSRITATEVDVRAWELELITTAPVDPLDFTAEGAILELLA